LNEFIKKNDWIEIPIGLNAYGNEKISYFNIITKETLYEKPNILLNGKERHLNQINQNKLILKKQNINNESEIIKLKEELEKYKTNELLNNNNNHNNNHHHEINKNNINDHNHFNNNKNKNKKKI